MADDSRYGSNYTEEETKNLERKIDEVYREARRDIQKKMDDFNRKFEAKDTKYRAMLEKGEIDKDQYESWLRGQVFQGQQWQAKQEQIERVISNANHISMSMINEGAVPVFGTNLNFMSYSIEKGCGVDFGFSVVNNDAVMRMIKNDPDLLPKWKINEPKDYKWNKQKVGNCITQGIIQGESLDKIGKRLSTDLCASNDSHMKTFARTAMTGAQNAGRLESMSEAQKLGIDIEKEWMATLDSYTRDSHADMDGESVPLNSQFSNKCDYPGDPYGPPAEVYNCRCDLVENVKKYPSFYSRRDNVTGAVLNKLSRDTVANLTYRDWVITKKLVDTAHRVDAEEQVTNTLIEVASMGTGQIDYQFGGHKLTDFKYKSFDSAFRKVYKDVANDAEKEGIVLTREEMYRRHLEYASRTTDALRFTNISSVETYTQDYNTIMTELENRGYTVIRVKNTIIKKDVPYRGVNSLIQSPSGYTFELQFHTPQSIDIKERINHPLYEEARKLPDGDKHKDELNYTMMQNMNTIVTPVNAEEIKTFDNSEGNVFQFGRQ